MRGHGHTHRQICLLDSTDDEARSAPHDGAVDGALSALDSDTFFAMCRWLGGADLRALRRTCRALNQRLVAVVAAINRLRHIIDRSNDYTSDLAPRTSDAFLAATLRGVPSAEAALGDLVGWAATNPAQMRAVAGLSFMGDARALRTVLQWPLHWASVNTLLLVAARGGHDLCAQELLEAGAKVDLPQTDGLHSCTQRITVTIYAPGN